MGMTRKFDPTLGQYRDSGKFDGNDNQPAAGGMTALGDTQVTALELANQNIDTSSIDVSDPQWAPDIELALKVRADGVTRPIRIEPERIGVEWSKNVEEHLGERVAAIHIDYPEDVSVVMVRNEFSPTYNYYDTGSPVVAAWQWGEEEENDFNQGETATAADHLFQQAVADRKFTEHLNVGKGSGVVCHPVGDNYAITVNDAELNEAMGVPTYDLLKFSYDPKENKVLGHIAGPRLVPHYDESLQAAMNHMSGYEGADTRGSRDAFDRQLAKTIKDYEETVARTLGN